MNLTVLLIRLVTVLVILAVGFVVGVGVLAIAHWIAEAAS